MSMPSGLGFALDAEVPRERQDRLIALGREGGELSAGSSSKSGDPFWKWATLRLPTRACLSPRVLDYFARRPPADFDHWAYCSRLDPTLDWEWLPGPASELVRGILRPHAPLFQKLTRVKLLLQLPGKRIIAHRDLVPGTVYDDMASEFDHGRGASRLTYRGASWLEEVKPLEPASHRDNLYLAMKIPLSERADEPGRPFVTLAGRKRHYTSDNRLFFLNEVEIDHGADPVDYWRGVVFVNGIWDAAAVARAAKEPLRLLD